MTKAEDFLAGWVNSYINAEARDVLQIDETIDEIVSDAEEDGITRADLEDAAHGNLRGHLLSAIRKASGE